jgi:predicted small metal-binding protein
MARGLDCKDPAHDDIHFTAENDDELFRKIQGHRDEYHSEMSDDEIKQLISSAAYNE